jgi:hypothetical protein
MTRENRRDVLLKWLVFLVTLTLLLGGTMLYEFLIAAPTLET